MLHEALVSEKYPPIHFDGAPRGHPRVALGAAASCFHHSDWHETCFIEI